MVAGCSARGAEGAGRDGDVQSLRRKGQSHVAREAEFEDWRLKTSFWDKGHPEGWTPSGEEIVRNQENANIEHPTSNAEHRTEDGDSITRTRTTTRTNYECRMGRGASPRGRRLVRPRRARSPRLALVGVCRLVPDVFARDRRGKAPSRQTLPAQSMTIWSRLKRGRDSAGCDFGLRLSGRARKSAVQSAGQGRLGNCSLISSCFHLFPLASAVLIIKIIFKQALGRLVRAGGG